MEVFLTLEDPAEDREDLDPVNDIYDLGQVIKTLLKALSVK